MFIRGFDLYGDFLDLLEKVPFPSTSTATPPSTPPSTPPPTYSWTHEKFSMSTRLGNSDSNCNGSEGLSAVVSRPRSARHLISEAEHAPGWRSWLDKENFAFFILGLLVSIPMFRQTKHN